MFHLLDDPAKAGGAAYAYFEDGGLVVEQGRVSAVGGWSEVASAIAPDASVEHFDNAIIAPGFIDAHVHMPQVGIIGSYGAQLLDWLERYAFPAEEKFADVDHAHAAANAFVEALLRCGTTSALVFATVHKHSVDALFKAARSRNMRLIAGKVLMDRNAPEALRDTVETGYADSKSLIETWHGRGRLGYAVTPRFAHTSSPEQLAAAGQLLREFPEVLLHTHISENHAEIAQVRAGYPAAPDYLGAYEAHGLVGGRTVLAHCVHLSDSEWARMGKAGAAAAFCPSSNLFLGSGLFDLTAAEHSGVEVGLASDVGGGTSLSMLEVMEDAYKVSQLRRRPLDAFKGFYLATLGAARALRIDAHVGNFAPGKEADFVVLDLDASPMLSQRLRGVTDITDILFALSILGDDRAVARTYVAGELAYQRA
ncbi:guanine deaminase [alpha proteobacterium U9-1i]|nr:guanine deaminase [alpha proteobacterium U9-1i]